MGSTFVFTWFGVDVSVAEDLVRGDLLLHHILLFRYSGPGHQLVTEKWTVDFNTLSSSLMQFAVLEVDGSGSGGRGRQLLERVRGRLGRPEVDDQLAALRYVRRKFK